ncbi:hypothetical protein [Rhodococcus koreensis]|uniref:hypothetical protein n=1 Tax=Rhodococcus koreensis TaxID=99653 RepID=UPI00115F9B43|nr:hypothetical protein [Rhodococcus koreensis]
MRPSEASTADGASSSARLASSSSFHSAISVVRRPPVIQDLPKVIGAGLLPDGMAGQLVDR